MKMTKKEIKDVEHAKAYALASLLFAKMTDSIKDKTISPEAIFYGCALLVGDLIAIQPRPKSFIPILLQVVDNRIADVRRARRKAKRK